METEYPTIPLRVLRNRTERTLQETAELLGEPPDQLWDRALNTLRGKHPKLDRDHLHEAALLDAAETLHRAEKAAFCFAE